MDKAEFVSLLGGIFESSPWVAEAVWAMRPFDTVDGLHSAMCGVVVAGGTDKQEALVRAHPDLVGEAALAGTLSRESAREQASAGLDRLSREECAEFAEKNRTYREKFGFPFVICVRANKKEAILSGFNQRLGNSRDAELRTALDEIARIARLRLHDLITEEK